MVTSMRNAVLRFRYWISLLVVLLIPIEASSVVYEGNYNGSYDSSVKWMLDTETGVLTISGKGEMKNYSSSTPYNSYVGMVKSIVVEEGITSIGDYAFNECRNLESVSLPNSILSIGNNAFFMCEKLPSVSIPDGVITIKSGAFSLCRALTSVTIPASVTEITGSIFSYCRNLTTIIVDSGNTVYDSRNGCNAIMETSTNRLISGCKESKIPSDTKKIGILAFCGCTYDFTSIEIPEGVEEIEGSAFSSCSYLKEVTLPSTLRKIQDNAFNYCSKLESIIIPENVESIGNLAFDYCYALKKVVSLNPTPPSLMYRVFLYTDTLYVPYGKSYEYRQAKYWKEFKEIKELPPYDFESEGFYYNFVSKKEQTCELTYMDGSNYYNNYKAYMGSVSVPSKTTYNGKTYDVIRIGDNAFNSCSKLDSIRIPNSIESIGYNAFRSCYNLKHVEIPNSVKKIEYGAFAWCKGFATITLPD